VTRDDSTGIGRERPTNAVDLSQSGKTRADSLSDVGNHRHVAVKIDAQVESCRCCVSAVPLSNQVEKKTIQLECLTIVLLRFKTFTSLFVVLIVEKEIVRKRTRINCYSKCKKSCYVVQDATNTL